MQLKIFMTYYILQNELDSNLIDFYPALTFLLITHLYHFLNLNYIMFLSIQHIILLNLKKSFMKRISFYLMLLTIFQKFVPSHVFQLISLPLVSSYMDITARKHRIQTQFFTMHMASWIYTNDFIN